MTLLRQIINTYHGRSFKISHILCDRHFESIIKHTEPIDIMVNTTGTDENIPAIERFIKTGKERIWAIINTLPFEKYPHQLIVESVDNAVFWMNCFPHKDEIHVTLSPCPKVTGSHIEYHKHCKLQFATHVQVHEQHKNSLLL